MNLIHPVQNKFLREAHVEALKKLLRAGCNAELYPHGKRFVWADYKWAEEEMSEAHYHDHLSAYKVLDNFGLVKAVWRTPYNYQISVPKEKAAKILKAVRKYDEWVAGGKPLQATRFRKRWLKNPLVNAVRSEVLSHEHVEALKELLRGGGEARLLAKGRKYEWETSSERPRLNKGDFLRKVRLYDRLDKLGFVRVNLESGGEYDEEHEINVPREKILGLLELLGVYDEWRASHAEKSK